MCITYTIRGYTVNIRYRLYKRVYILYKALLTNVKILQSLAQCIDTQTITKAFERLSLFIRRLGAWYGHFGTVCSPLGLSRKQYVPFARMIVPPPLIQRRTADPLPLKKYSKKIFPKIPQYTHCYTHPVFAYFKPPYRILYQKWIDYTTYIKITP